MAIPNQASEDQGPASTNIVSNSDNRTSQHSLDENRVYCSAVIPRVASDSFRKDNLMNASTATISSSSVYTTPAFWERLWRTAGIQSFLCFLVAYIVYGHQPQIGA